MQTRFSPEQYQIIEKEMDNRVYKDERESRQGPGCTGGQHWVVPDHLLWRLLLGSMELTGVICTAAPGKLAHYMLCAY